MPVEDELQNIEMAEEERRKKRQELKIKKRDYTGYDDDEFAEGNQGLMKRSILSKYDEEIEGSRTSVRLMSIFFDFETLICSIGIQIGQLDNVI